MLGISPTPNPAPRGGELFPARFGGRTPPKPRRGEGHLLHLLFVAVFFAIAPKPRRGEGHLLHLLFVAVFFAIAPQTALVVLLFLWERQGMGLEPQLTQAVVANKMLLYNQGNYR